MEDHDIKCDETPCNWLGDGAEFPGLTGGGDKEDFDKILMEFHPRTGEPLVQKARRN
ncbi:hypothetical protein ACFL5Q_00115 [Planctomycetota bacterium]